MQGGSQVTAMHSIGNIAQKVHAAASFVFLLQPKTSPHNCRKMQTEVLKREYFRLFRIAFLK